MGKNEIGKFEIEGRLEITPIKEARDDNRELINIGHIDLMKYYMTELDYGEEFEEKLEKKLEIKNSEPSSDNNNDLNYDVLHADPLIHKIKIPLSQNTLSGKRTFRKSYKELSSSSEFEVDEEVLEGEESSSSYNEIIPEDEMNAVRKKKRTMIPYTYYPHYNPFSQNMGGYYNYTHQIDIPTDTYKPNLQLDPIYNPLNSYKENNVLEQSGRNLTGYEEIFNYKVEENAFEMNQLFMKDLYYHIENCEQKYINMHRQINIATSTNFLLERLTGFNEGVRRRGKERGTGMNSRRIEDSLTQQHYPQQDDEQID
jgi:hypothetical protein